MPQSHAPRVHTIAPTRPFVDALATGLLGRHRDDPLDLADVTVLLPTRRACRLLREAFLRQGAGRALLLPRMMALGDVDEDAMLLDGSAIAAPGGPDPASDPPPAIPTLRRQLLLARLIAARPLGPDGDPPTPARAVALARDLAGLLDQAQTERLSLADLKGLVPERHAAHWQTTVDFLAILSDLWPKVLAAEGALDPAARRDRLMTARTQAWREQPPSTPVVAAGSTGSIPATAELLAVVAGLPAGAVVLPGLDLTMDAPSWDSLEPTHPQFGMRRLLNTLNLTRADVTPWPVPHQPDTAVETGREARVRLLAEAMRPAATTDGWRDLPPLPAEALAGVARVTCPGPREEAEAVALMMRETLETPGRTAALVTPDRDLARRVAALLDRWGLTVDDSAGQPLAVTPPGALLRLLAEAAAEDLAPAALLDLLRHPLVAAGYDTGRFHEVVRRLDREVLRGPRAAGGWDGLRAAVSERARSPRRPLLDLLDRLERLLGPLAAMMRGPALPPRALVDLHMRCAEALSASDETPGPLRLWAGPAGEAAAAFAADLLAACDGLPPMAPKDYPGVLDALMVGQPVRRPFGTAPRLSILGSLEARAWHADLMILGGLNEGTWPPDPGADPWMSRPMRADFGLPAPEQRIGLSAHDFAQAVAAPRVALTRAERVEGTPTVPSRWLLRLEAVADAVGLGAVWAASGHGPWLGWAAALRAVETIEPAPPPAPRPPPEARPNRLSVTRIETWRRDPYAIYARFILGLEALDDLDRPLGAADYGTLVHAALERFRLDHPEHLPDDAENRLLAIGETLFAGLLADPGTRAFWWPRFQRTAAWVTAEERRRSAELRRVHVERRGSLDLAGVARPSTLTGTADRIESRADGTLVVVDHKTGQPPSRREVAAGYAPQLPLEAAMIAAGGFPDVPADAPVAALEYWRLRGARDSAGEIRSVADDPAILAKEAMAGLVALVNLYADPDTPYLARPVPDKAPRYSDYDHLARVAEWAAAGDEAGEEVGQ